MTLCGTEKDLHQWSSGRIWERMLHSFLSVTNVALQAFLFIQPSSVFRPGSQILMVRGLGYITSGKPR